MAIQLSSEFYYRQWRRKIDPLFPTLCATKTFSMRKDIHSLKDLRIAAILDPFSELCYEYECSLLNLDGRRYMKELKEFQPDVFLFESAWRGKENTWMTDVSTPTPKFQQVVAWCRAHRIPVVFWNKEDPVHTDRFKNTAALADYVFTTEADLIPQYKAWLGHDRVYLLQFAAQPAVHNPIETFERKNKICFAGSWYKLFPYRNTILSHYIDMLESRNGVEIYDRYYDLPDSPNKFPSKYHSIIMGTLPPDQIDVAYKGYMYGLNMCSVTESRTMFARRMFELAASNTLVISNNAYGVKCCFGDLTIATDDMEEAARLFDERYTGTHARRIRLLMLRKVLREHLYEDRLDRIISIVFGVHLKQSLPDIYIVDTSTEPEEHETIQKSFDAQTYTPRHLIRREESTQIPDDAFVGILSPRDHYGPNYLTDLMYSLRYADLEGFVKPDTPMNAYHPTEIASLRRAIVRMGVLRAQECNFDEGAVVRGQFLWVDEFNYQPDRAEGWSEDLDDIYVENQGLSLAEIETEVPYQPEWQELSLEEIYAVAASSDKETIRTEMTKKHVRINNSAEKGITYKRLTRLLVKESYSALNNGLEICFHMETVEGAEAVGACVFRTEGVQAEIGPAFLKANEMCRVYIPPKCSGFNLQIRLEPNSVVKISGISIRRAFKPLWFNRLDKSDTMILTNLYPRYDNPFSNLPVHERVKQYRNHNHSVQVFRLDDLAGERIWQYEGQNVFSVHSLGLNTALDQIRTVCVHFLTVPMWKVLRNHLDHIRLLIWLHGPEIQPGISRHIPGDSELSEEQYQDSEARKKMWLEVFNIAKDAGVHFVCVSDYLARGVAADYKLSAEFIESNFDIIHNSVDGDCFKYRKKTAEHRLHLLTIQPSGTSYHNTCFETTIQKEIDLIFPDKQ